jgi:hypothetical protein
MPDKPFYDSSLFWVGFAAVIVVIGGILIGIGVADVGASASTQLWSDWWFRSGLGCVVLGLVMLWWALTLYFAHRHAEKHIQAFQLQPLHSRSDTAQRTSKVPQLPTQQQSTPVQSQPQPTASQPTSTPTAPTTLSNRTLCLLSPKELTRLFNQGATQLQSQSLVETYIGQWRQVVGIVSAVEKLNVVVTSVSCTDTDQIHLSLFFDPATWDVSLRGLMPGDSVKANGELMSVHTHQVVFKNCELA